MGLFQAIATAASLLVSLATAAPGPVPEVAPASPTLRGVWPVQPHLIQRPFEPPTAAWASGHRGVDLRGTIGMPVVASVAGTVTFAGTIAGRGVLVISHGETRTTYEPVIAEARRGAVVEAGDRIGVLEVTQSHCFPSACLHWGWIRGTEYLDPLRLVQEGGPVRLLPLRRAGGPVDRRS